MAHVPHIYVPGPWGEATIDPPPQTAAHLERALRLGEGASIAYTDGRGTVGAGTWRSSRLTRGPERVVPAGPVQLTMAVAAPRSVERQRFVVEKLGELGAARLVWLDTRFGEGHPRRPEKTRSWAVSALEQSRRAQLLDVVGPMAWEDLDRPLFVAQPGAADPTGVLADAGLTGSLTVAIGPEGGFAPGELPTDSTAVGLGDGVLRIETAAIVTAALVLVREAPTEVPGRV